MVVVEILGPAMVEALHLVSVVAARGVKYGFADFGFTASGAGSLVLNGGVVGTGLGGVVVVGLLSVGLL